MKRFASILLALAMVFAMTTTAFAATTTDGKITVENTVKDVTYNIYRIFDLESFSGTNYSYKVSTKWASFFAEGAKGLEFVTIENGYVTWKTDAKAADFAKEALAYAKANTIANDGTAKCAEDGADVVFSNLPLGYYLVDSSLGALCALTTTDKEATIVDKNSKPSLDKWVKEDSKTGDDAWGKVNDADIGQIVEYKAIVTVQGNAYGYVVHDTMGKGLTYDKVTKVTLNGNDVDASNYEVKTNVTHGEGEEAVTHTFDVEFSDTFCNGLKTGDVIVVYYQATVNENAVVAQPELNDAYLEYEDKNEESHKTEKSETKTYTWDLDVLKFANGNKDTKLQGVKFVLLNKEGTKVATVVNGKLTGWVDVPAADTDGTITWPANTVLTTDANGKIEIDGLDSDSYKLREIEALPGYNKLENDIDVTVTAGTESGTTVNYTTTVAEVNNQSGTELPETGGMGTTLFYVLGGILVAGAAILLVVKRRMSGAER